MRSRAPKDETPVGYRHAKWNYHVLSQWIDPGETERHVEWTRGVDRALSDYAEEALYVNFVGDPSTSAIRGVWPGELRAASWPSRTSTTPRTCSAATRTSRRAARRHAPRRPWGGARAAPAEAEVAAEGELGIDRGAVAARGHELGLVALPAGRHDPGTHPRP